MTLKEKIGVVGAGLMGAEIAFVHALAGHPVLLADTSGDALDRAMARLSSIYDKERRAATMRLRRKPRR